MGRVCMCLAIDYKSNKNFIIAKTACERAQNVLTVADEDAKISADTTTTADATAKQCALRNMLLIDWIRARSTKVLAHHLRSKEEA